MSRHAALRVAAQARLDSRVEEGVRKGSIEIIGREDIGVGFNGKG